MSDRAKYDPILFSVERLRLALEAAFYASVQLKNLSVDLEKGGGCGTFNLFRDGKETVHEFRFGYNNLATEFDILLGEISYGATFDESSGRMLPHVGMQLG